ncbi:hypothetical protein MBBAR_3c01740 [Methanobrevibacter arboriphilus JCM 13429 = DSM 1125]|uniref:Uncharacterized protein n=1 Tax=Methanobrevibacter arboriphilus JCM 13429 = DSM 1125 TaxID=1300164 RepID=A0A1V6N487_METAZ|nr:hypothetical protein [Methanobrevibacter arboriphilus]OQD59518.1 hypothetical protein MBBAR_3c01740 [Methanobrevibacter arboriphilus JCM 13429 = DSM 1125]
MTKKILNIKKVKNPSKHNFEIEIHILEEGIVRINYKSANDNKNYEKIYFKNLTEKDTDLIKENLNKDVILITYSSEEEYEKQSNIPINERKHYILKLKSWRLTN